MSQNQYKITKDIIVERILNSGTTLKFGVVSSSDKLFKQYIAEPNINKTVNVETKIFNKLYFQTNPKLKFDSLSLLGDITATKLRFYFRENSGWESDKLFGIWVVVKDLDSSDILLSYVIQNNELQLFDSKIRIDGYFWPEYVDLFIPKINKSNIAISAVSVLYDDIILDEHNIELGKVLSPINYVPLINSLPVPDYIALQAKLDTDMCLHFQVVSTDLQKSVEQVILDYFKLNPGVVINVEYQIDYGNDTIGYKSLIVKNAVNKYGPISFFPNYQKNQNINVIVTLQIRIDDKLIERQFVVAQDLSTTHFKRISDMLNQDVDLVHHVIDYRNEVNVNNVLIQEHKQQKQDVIIIDTPVYIQTILSDNIIKLKDNRLITFENVKLSEDSRLVLLKSDNTIEMVMKPFILPSGKLYFDFSMVNLDTNVNKYQLINDADKSILVKGKLEH